LHSHFAVAWRAGAALGRRPFALQIGLLGGGLLDTRHRRRCPAPNANAKSQQGADSEGDPRKSYSFSGVQNTSRAGVPVPVVYGETLVGSVVVSAGIDIVQVSG
jgi:hypothetical protein